MSKHLRSRLDEFIKGAVAKGSKPYLIVDAGWQPDLAESIRSHADGWEPLMGAYGEQKASVHMGSPLLVDATLHRTALDTWLEDGFPARLGIVVFSRLPIEGLRTSLKRFITILTPESQKPSYFRFFDARTLYCFLTSGFPQQWRDFFRDIETILAPSDLTTGWTIYEVKANELRIGIQSGQGLNWRVISGADDDEAYQAFMPFRRIAPEQYQAIMSCAQRGLHQEIADFLTDAFPQAVAPLTKEELLGIIARSEVAAKAADYDSEECVFYWAVLAFLIGEEFHQQPDVSKFLEIRYMSREAKLARLLKGINRDYIENEALADLVAGYTMPKE